jgi:hypothetical protein
MRMAQAASVSEKPMARKTGDGVIFPDEQAAPADTEIPARSQWITWVSADTRGMMTQVVLGRRGVLSPTTMPPLSLKVASMVS